MTDTETDNMDDCIWQSCIYWNLKNALSSFTETDTETVGSSV